ncbi:hypothetical protein [Hyphomicrobium sp.]|uniref:hypothetical protein n=1 Tax=Hyphomicrobium sp. TaxID=82 RepID=UPI002B84531F|nr:hypothetical protein [Hyphomicrobium sp.]HRN87826.1 hypothetical protein [Hyphomicrobium sp.]HRQ26643.1 hypothetical protein [Hyphomicrobium sp.]
MKFRSTTSRMVFATLVAGAALIPASAMAKTMPDAYRGVWMNMEGRSASCESSDWDGPNHTDTHIRVTRDELHFAEGSCAFTSVKTSDFGDAHVAMSCGAEGETYKTSEIWLLTTIREHKMLVMTSRDREIGATIVYQQCP